MATRTIFISPTGDIQFIYTDALRSFLRHGEARIARASHVEPTADSKWTADLTPVGGPILGPFPERSAALQAETDWLLAHPETWPTPR